MSASVTTIAAAEAPDRRPLRLAAAFALVVVLALLWLAAGLLAWRRAAGALTVPPAAVLLLAASFPAAILAAAARRTLLAVPQVLWPAARNLLWWCPSGALALLAAALSLPGASAAGWLVLWAPLAAEEVWALWRRHAPPPIADDAHEAAFCGLPPDATQQFTRSATADGGDRLCGRLRLRFAPGQRSMKADVAFCPPFAHAPVVTADVADGPPARVKVVQSLSYGARLDVRLVDLLDEPADVLLEFSASKKGTGVVLS